MLHSAYDPGHVEAHYSPEGLEGAILAALAGVAENADRMDLENLAPLDEFHIRGRKATLELANRIGLEEGMHVLDVGCGLGGPSRFLAAHFGCRVTGLDLSKEYCRIADMLTRMVGLEGRVAYHHGNALNMPYEDAAFHVVWTQHASMNIPDKGGLYEEMGRVLKPGGLLALYDICSGEGGGVHFPVPWARDPSISFLDSPRQLRAMLEEAGFEIVDWRDTTEEGRSWFRRRKESVRHKEQAPLGLHLLLGKDFGMMMENQLRNLEEERIALIEAVVRRPIVFGQG